MFSRLTTIQKGIALALAGYTGFAISDASAKFLTGTYPVLLIITYIMAFAALFLLLLSPWMGGITKPKESMIKLHILRAVMNFLVSVLIVFAFKYLQLATAYAIIFAKPFIAALIAIPLYGEAVTRSRWMAILLGFAGILIAMRPVPESFEPALLLPLGAAFCAALMWVVSRSMEKESAFALGFYPVIGTGLLCMPFVISDFQIPAPAHILFFMICGAGVAIGVIGLSLAFRSAPSAAVSPFHYSQMIWGLLFGYVIFADIPDIWTIAGAVIIIASGLYLIETERRNSQA